ncbi:phosphoribosylanthranilate isomerase [uncultured Acidaminococcus sp.]|uniref:phosphoribosylanthranilate isomerase n=1 Tax=uncultured Acidaminococcus sp. TaxID=352152 RepID=UPI0026707CED|nr:phosphoribosylanthranilate isomerase [uncultured Acidaminococcus sp.]
MTKIKLCGIRRPEDVAMVNRVKPDYAGFVFAPGRRQVKAEQAENLRRQLDPAIAAVGVFVKAPVEEAAALANRGTIQLIQLHGEEDEAYVKALRERTKAPIIRVIRVRGPESLWDLDRYDCDYFLLDTYSGSQFGGMGKTFDHSLIRQARFPRPFFLAGGLDSANVAAAIAESSPFGVDTSSGIETAGIKDENKIRAFVSAVRKEEQS